MNKISRTIGIIAAAAVMLALFVLGARALGKGGLPAPGTKTIQNLIADNKLDEARAKIDEIAAKKPDAKAVGKLYFELARACEDRKEIVKARDAYQAILRNYPNVDNILEVQDRIGPINTQILFSNILTDKDVTYTVNPGDTLGGIAKKFGTTVELIKKANSLSSDTIKAYSKLKVSKIKYKILADKSQNSLTLLADDEFFKAYRVSTGENNCTPVGAFKIVNRIADPVWYTQGAIVPAESPDNILGTHWLGLSAPGYGIHGTLDPKSIGTQATKGCVRMLNEEVEELYTIVPVGTEVAITD